jgi:hypothetical protein
LPFQAQRETIIFNPDLISRKELVEEKKISFNYMVADRTQQNLIFGSKAQPSITTPVFL